MKSKGLKFEVRSAIWLAMSDIGFDGAFTALVTPFRNGAVDEESLRRLTERQIEAGIHGLVPCGTTGESVALNAQEHAEVVRIVAEQTAGRVPVIAGAGTNSTAKSIELAKLSREAGANGLLLVCPYYNRPTQAGLEAHFRAICDAVPLPAMLYNIPGRSACDLSTDTLLRLADVPSIAAVKDATGNILRAQEVLSRSPDRFAVLSGDDALTLGMMAVGARGVVSVTANLFPTEVVQIVELALAKDFEAARERHLRLLPIHQAMFVETNPGPIKALMAKAELLGPEMRLPMVAPSDEVMAPVHELVVSAGFTR